MMFDVDQTHVDPITLDCRSGTRVHEVISGRMRLRAGLSLGSNVQVYCYSCNKRGMASMQGTAIRVEWT